MSQLDVLVSIAHDLTSAFHAEEWYRRRAADGALSSLVIDLAPTLAGISGERLSEVGFVVIDDEDGMVVGSEPVAAPTSASHGRATPALSGLAG